VYLHPAHPGTGIIAGGAVRKIFAVSGIRDIIAKQHGAPNMITNARVALKALKALKPTSMNVSFGSKKSEATVTEVTETKEEKKTPAVKKAPAKKKAE
jgi:small subunit ribosomal protein S5